MVSKWIPSWNPLGNHWNFLHDLQVFQPPLSQFERAILSLSSLLTSKFFNVNIAIVTIVNLQVCQPPLSQFEQGHPPLKDLLQLSPPLKTIIMSGLLQDLVVVEVLFQDITIITEQIGCNNVISKHLLLQ